MGRTWADTWEKTGCQRETDGQDMGRHMGEDRLSKRDRWAGHGQTHGRRQVVKERQMGRTWADTWEKTGFQRETDGQDMGRHMGEDRLSKRDRWAGHGQTHERRQVVKERQVGRTWADTWEKTGCQRETDGQDMGRHMAEDRLSKRDRWAGHGQTHGRRQVVKERQMGRTWADTWQKTGCQRETDGQDMGRHMGEDRLSKRDRWAGHGQTHGRRQVVKERQMGRTWADTWEKTGCQRETGGQDMGRHMGEDRLSKRDRWAGHGQTHGRRQVVKERQVGRTWADTWEKTGCQRETDGQDMGRHMGEDRLSKRDRWAGHGQTHGRRQVVKERQVGRTWADTWEKTGCQRETDGQDMGRHMGEDKLSKRDRCAGHGQTHGRRQVFKERQMGRTWADTWEKTGFQRETGGQDMGRHMREDRLSKRDRWAGHGQTHGRRQVVKERQVGRTWADTWEKTGCQRETGGQDMGRHMGEDRLSKRA